MKRLIIVFISVAFILMGCQEESMMDKKYEPQTIEHAQIVGLGDSLTQGVGDDEQSGGYFGRITEELSQVEHIEQLHVVNFAKRGRTSKQLLKQLKEDEEVRSQLKEADLIAFTIGGNDIMSVMKQHLFELKKDPFEAELPKFKKRLYQIIKELEKLNPKATIVLTGIYNPVNLVTTEEREFASIIEEWNQEMEDVMAEKSERRLFVQIDDVQYSSNPAVYSADYFHPNAEGYAFIADNWFQQLLYWNERRDEPLLWLMEVKEDE